MKFHKYQGTGNDFVIIDNRNYAHQFTTKQVAFLCNRRSGIGGDGLILLENTEGYDFNMKYYNADGKESTMCGNGGRCITAFANSLGIISNKTNFLAIDGVHFAEILENSIVSLKMKDVSEIVIHGNSALLNTGSPHYVRQVKNVSGYFVFDEGRKIRNRPEFKTQGINVNFFEPIEDKLYVRTYERGIESETLSCGTGATASAIAYKGFDTGIFDIKIETLGGPLKVTFTKPEPTVATDIFLSGPATFVFSGEITF